MFFSSYKSKKQVLFELQELIKKEFSEGEQFTFWEKRTFKKRKILNLILKNGIFINLFLYAKIINQMHTEKEQIPSSFLSFYYHYFLTNEYLFNFSDYRFRKSNKWKNYIDLKKKSIQLFLKKTFPSQNFVWFSQSPTGIDQLIQKNISVEHEKKLIFYGNFIRLILFQSKNKLQKTKDFQHKSFKLGYFLAGYLLSHYGLRYQSLSKRMIFRKKTGQKINNNFFYCKMFFAKNYIKELKHFLPTRFNFAIKSFNLAIDF